MKETNIYKGIRVGYSNRVIGGNMEEIPKKQVYEIVDGLKTSLKDYGLYKIRNGEEFFELADVITNTMGTIDMDDMKMGRSSYWCITEIEERGIRYR